MYLPILFILFFLLLLFVIFASQSTKEHLTMPLISPTKIPADTDELLTSMLENLYTVLEVRFALF
jgi:hypothetical protein